MNHRFALAAASALLCSCAADVHLGYVDGQDLGERNAAMARQLPETEGRPSPEGSTLEVTVRVHLVPASEAGRLARLLDYRDPSVAVAEAREWAENGLALVPVARSAEAEMAERVAAIPQTRSARRSPVRDGDALRANVLEDLSGVRSFTLLAGGAPDPREENVAATGFTIRAWAAGPNSVEIELVPLLVAHAGETTADRPLADLTARFVLGHAQPLLILPVGDRADSPGEALLSRPGGADPRVALVWISVEPA